MTTARQLIKSALRKIGAITKNENPTADEAVDGLQALNGILSSWSNDSTKIYARAIESFVLTSGDGEYTIGAGADFNTTRPVSIVSAYVRSGDVDYTLEKVTDSDFADIGFKSVQGIPRYINYDYNYATGKIKLYPVPGSGYTLYLISEKELSTIASLDTDIAFPPGWERALIYNLALDLSPEYGQPVTQEIYSIASEAKTAITTAILRNKTMDVPRGLNTSRNIYNGYY